MRARLFCVDGPEAPQAALPRGDGSHRIGHALRRLGGLGAVHLLAPPLGRLRRAALVRHCGLVRTSTIGSARITYVGKHQPCMV